MANYTRKTLNEDVAGIAAKYLMNNAESFYFITGQLKTKKLSKPLSIPTINAIAKELLEQLDDNLDKMGLEREVQPELSYRMQLLDTIFLNVYHKASLESKREIIKNAYQVDREEMTMSRRKIVYYQIARKVSLFFHNPFVKYSLAGVAWIATLIASIAARSLLLRVIRRSALPISVVKIISHKHFVQLTFLALVAINWLTNSRFSWIAQVVALGSGKDDDPLHNIKVKLLYSFIKTADTISELITRIFTNRLKLSLDIGGQHAYNVWIKTMNRAAKEGICEPQFTDCPVLS